jgi:hypothetical protein
VDHGLRSPAHLVCGQPALYVATREGLAWTGLWQLDPTRVGVSETTHWATCARLAVELEYHERVEVWGAPRLRAAELEAGHAVASARLGTLVDGRPRSRRPDLVLFPPAPIAVEVEPSVGKGHTAVKGGLPGSARCRTVSEVRYTPRRMFSVPFPAPFPASAPTTRSAVCHSATP